MKALCLIRHARAALKNRSRAQTLLEFALALPIFLMIVVGTVDLGRGIAAYNIISNAAHEGARAGIYPAGASDTQASANAPIVAAVNSETAFLGNIPDSLAGTDPGTGTYVVIGANTWNPEDLVFVSHPVSTDPQSERTSGSRIVVTVHYRFYPVTPILSNLVGSSINLSSTSTMPIE